MAKNTITTINPDQLRKISDRYRADSIAECEWMSEAEATEFYEDYRADDLTDLAEYSFRLTGELRTSDGVAWTAEILLGGKPVITVEQDGHGGPNFYYPHPGEANEVVKAYKEASRKAFPKIVYEVEDHATSILDIAYTQG